VSAGGTRTARHWWPTAGRIRYKHDTEYADHFREVLASAVGDRLRGLRAAWAELSGGLDSSTVVCLADALARNGSVGHLHTISRVSDLLPIHDERRFISCIERQRGRLGVHIKTEDCYGQVDIDSGWTSPLHPSGHQLAVVQYVADHRGDVILSGEFGDQVTSHSPHITAVLGGLWGCHRYQDIVRTLRAHSRDHYTTAYADIWHVITSHWPPQSRRAAVRDLSLSQIDPHTSGGQAPYALDGRQLALFRDALCSAGERWYAPKASSRVPYTYPFADRRVLEFMAAIPTHVVSRLGRSRSLLREAMSGIVPPQILGRASKTMVTSLEIQLAPEIVLRLANDVSQIELLREGYLERSWWDATCALLRRDPWPHRGMARRIVTAEHWLRLRARPVRQASPWCLVEPPRTAAALRRYYSAPRLISGGTIQGV
jgi:asparagine synthase (glutamine-hydrolysing)